MGFLVTPISIRAFHHLVVDSGLTSRLTKWASADFEASFMGAKINCSFGVAVATAVAVSVSVLKGSEADAVSVIVANFSAVNLPAIRRSCWFGMMDERDFRGVKTSFILVVAGLAAATQLEDDVTA